MVEVINLFWCLLKKAEFLLFVVLPSILIFTLYLMLGSFLAFLDPIRLCWKSGEVKNANFDLNLGSFLAFWGSNGLF